ncbi:wax ester synthase/diacylglycerol acyltransferase 4 [Arachis hypogaea]|uniref:Uncharacterized protein n=1 Tax=Arachis hypogaea TaxID=3818 RepID=A0A444ZMS2_ARAHY|nr:O-acyltransferase WSD1 [Arachis hypogaea]QHO08697.1 O-acyltransferase [Arachis hypogaea]RYR15405.1 hypothetical protein Ahy_B04g072148 [Arachis hypogaea]
MEDLKEPVSPTGQFLESDFLNLYIIGVLEFQVPIHNLPIVSLVRDAFHCIPRFTSIMVVDQKGVKRWKRVEVKFEEHIIEPKFSDAMSMEKQYGEYLSGIAMEKLPKNKPLWEAHIIKYPTKNAAGTVIFKFHHAIGDGYTIMGLLLSSLQRHDDPSLPLSFPSKSSSSSNKDYNSNKLFLLKILPKLFSITFNSIVDFGWSVMKSTFLEDDETPIRSNVEGVEFLPITISHISFSIHHIKEIKSKLGVTINDVITGIIFYGIRLYMQDMDYKSRKLKSTAMAIVNTRNVKDYHTVQDMLKTNAKGVWGNHISYMHVSVPKLQDYPISNPLQFVKKAHNSIKRKKNSFATILTEKLLRMEHKLKGSEEVSKNIHRTLRNSSLLISNMVGPMEQMALANHPIKDLFFTLCGLPQSLVVTILSYMGMLRVTLATEEGFIDERKLVWNLNKAFEEILHEAENV